jgi:hypothetical protein
MRYIRSVLQAGLTENRHTSRNGLVRHKASESGVGQIGNSSVHCESRSFVKPWLADVLSVFHVTHPTMRYCLCQTFVGKTEKRNTLFT